ncbi:hypothetical protein [Streptomyces fulvorobeus]|uniref:Uncharacterized protein n=1 Tax=Streptomyces fulvorobeus TaxID=284028 RepID=A0A7Y9HAF2_9ACTN|nr:hypothetical protein [Streptomyces fulvorobeus]NYE40905.1 hypothetical protein [Streptomyces fulvorobeus]
MAPSVPARRRSAWPGPAERLRTAATTEPGRESTALGAAAAVAGVSRGLSEYR